MKGKYIKGRVITYDGSQLSPLWCFKNFDLQGDCILAFRGPCNVKSEFMVDQEDKKKGLTIAADDMLHFIVEVFHSDLKSIVLLQRLLVVAVMDAIKKFKRKSELRREGDNIYVTVGEEGWQKLSVSIATVSIISGLIHLGLNVSTEGTPVKTASLSEIGVSQLDDFAVEALRHFVDEFQGVQSDTYKVKPVV